MSIECIRATHSALTIGNVVVGMQSMSRGNGTGLIALSFDTETCGLRSGFHGDLAAMRDFAETLLAHVVEAEGVIAQQVTA